MGTIRCGLGAALWMLALVAAAGAQGTGRVTALDPSARSWGMGGASGAVFWGGNADAWANPALTAWAPRGISYERARSQLVPDLASDVFFTTERWTLAYAGVGLAVAGNPAGWPGGYDLDFGSSEITGPGGGPTGSFDTYERAEVSGFGVSMAGLVGAIGRWSGGAPAAFEWFDVGFGANSKRIETVFGPQSYLQASTTAGDVGVLVRFSPLDTGRGADPAAAPMRLDVAWGGSMLNEGPDALQYLNEPEPLVRITRSAFSARFTSGAPAGVAAGLGGRWFAAGLEPFLTAGAAFDRDWVGTTSGWIDHRVDHWGLELALANVLWFRYGGVDDDAGDVHDGTWGWGLALPVGRMGGVRYDYGTYPEARGLSDLGRDAWAAWVDPLAIWEALR